MNSLIESATGEYIAFFDDDDESVPERLTLQYDRLCAYQAKHKSSKILCYSNRLAISPDGGQAPVLAIGRSQPEPHGESVVDFLLTLEKAPPYCWGQFGSCTMMAKVKTLKNVGLFDPDFRRMAEWDLAIRLAFEGGHFIAVDKPLIKQFITHTADKSGRKPLEFGLLLRKKYKKYLGGKGVYRYAILMTHLRFYYARGPKWKYYLTALASLVVAPGKMLALFTHKNEV